MVLLGAVTYTVMMPMVAFIGWLVVYTAPLAAWYSLLHMTSTFLQLWKLRPPQPHIGAQLGWACPCLEMPVGQSPGPSDGCIPQWYMIRTKRLLPPPLTEAPASPCQWKGRDGQQPALRKLLTHGWWRP